MVPVLGDPVQSGEEGRAERAQAEDGLGQPARLGLYGAGDVHLEEQKGQKSGRVQVHTGTAALTKLHNSKDLHWEPIKCSGAPSTVGLEVCRKVEMSKTYIIKSSRREKRRNCPRGEQRETLQRVWMQKNVSML